MGKPRGPQVPFTPEIREQIRDLRGVCLMSLAEIADALGVNKRQVSRWSDGFSVSKDKPTLSISLEMANRIDALAVERIAKMGVPR